MNIKIMVVDDEPAILQITKIALEQENFTVIEANSGKECLDKLGANEIPELILLDIMMSEMSGYEVFEKIRKNSRYKNIKIAFFSAMAQDEDVKKGMALGADDFITKPFDPYEIIGRVNGIIQKRIF